MKLTDFLALRSQKFSEFNSNSVRSFSTVHSSILMPDFFCMSSHNILVKEVYRVTYHILLFVVVKIAYFSIDFHFYDIAGFRISVFLVGFLGPSKSSNSCLTF